MNREEESTNVVVTKAKLEASLKFNHKQQPVEDYFYKNHDRLSPILKLATSVTKYDPCHKRLRTGTSNIKTGQVQN